MWRFIGGKIKTLKITTVFELRQLHQTRPLKFNDLEGFFILNDHIMTTQIDKRDQTTQ